MFNVIGSIANVIRIVICIGLLIGAIIMVLIAAGVLVDLLLSSKLLYFVAALAVISAGCIAFDSATSQWLVQKVLNQLSHDVSRFERDLDELKADLEVGKQQILERDKQLKASAEQLLKQETIAANLKLIQSNMAALMNSMMSAHNDGVNLNELFSNNLKKFNILLDHMEHKTFNDMDMDKNGLIDANEFAIYVNTRSK